jgi:hypothetical protein
MMTEEQFSSGALQKLYPSMFEDLEEIIQIICGEYWWSGM